MPPLPGGNFLVVFGSYVGAEVSSSTLAIRLLNMRTRWFSKLPGSEGLYSPRWSPDGDHIAALKAGLETLWLYGVKT
jgi:hypothetical protein